jgi:hypothetical protein
MVRLYINGQLRIDKSFSQVPNAHTVGVFLTAGDHRVKLEYDESGGGPVALINWTEIFAL